MLYPFELRAHVCSKEGEFSIAKSCDSASIGAVMTKKSKAVPKTKAGVANPAKGEPKLLKGWKQIADFLGEPTSVVQRWASTGMPLRREGRYVEATVEELNQWLGKQSGKPVHVVTDATDLGAELKRGLAFVRGKK